jgi:5'-3' exonuclease
VKLLAVDGNNLLMRALHATKRASLTAHGVPTGPLLAFVNSLAKHIREEEPTHVGVAWDGAGRGIRREIDDDYKATRRAAPDAEHELKESSFALAREFCELAGIFQVGYGEGGVEADDIIADWWRDWIVEYARGSFVILSSDKDLLQLVDRATVEQIRLSSASAPTDRWDAARVREHYGVPVRLLPAILAIAGDSSDNIVGVHGIGPKKAAKALTECGFNFERCIAERWPDEQEQLAANYQLTNLRDSWPHVQKRPEQPPQAMLTGRGDPRFDARWPRLIAFLDQYDLVSVKTNLVARKLWSQDSSRSPVGRPLRLQ